MHKFTLCFLCAFLALAASAQVRLSWNNRIEAPADYNAVVFRGESVVLEAALTQYGIALPLDGTATLYYAVSGTTNYTASAASISGNKLQALWTPSLDSGAARYTFFLSANMSGGRIYRANGSITIQASPGPYPPIITQTGPTLTALQDSITAAGNTNAVQGVAIASLQTGQASLTGQVNAALAMSYAAGDQATLARNTANAAALTAGVARATGNYLAATQAVHTATLAGLSIASTGTYTIATGALARANEALARPVGTDTGTVTAIAAGIIGTNKVYQLDSADGSTTVGIGSNGLFFTRLVSAGRTWKFDIGTTYDENGEPQDPPSTYYVNLPYPLATGMYRPETPGLDYVDVSVAPDLSAFITLTLRDKFVYTQVTPAAPISITATNLPEGSLILSGLIYAVPSPSAITVGSSPAHAATNLLTATFATVSQVSTLHPKLAVFDTNTATTVSAVLEMEHTNNYDRLFIKRK